MNKINMNKIMALGLLAGVAAGGSAQAQEAGGNLLLRKLVEKGVLTQKEADELLTESQREAEQQFTMWQAAPDLPSWVQKLSMKGDLRLRAEYFNSDGITGGTPVRERLRYRLRYGVVATLNDAWMVGFRLASGTTSNPISANQTMDDDGANDTLTIDQAYAAWTPYNNMKLTFGKMPNPLRLDNAVWDTEYTPEGVAYNYTYELSQSHKFGFAMGGISVDESSGDSSDAYAGLAQVTLDSTLTPKLSSYVGVATYNLFNKEAAKEAHTNRGNTATYSGAGDKDQALSYNYNPVIIDAALTYKLDSFPMWEGSFPVKLGGTYINNPAVSEKNEGYLLGITLGKAQKAGTWQVGYQFRELQADSLYDNWPDSDFGAYGVGGDVSSFRGGTDYRGHDVYVKYQLTGSVQCTVRVMRTEAISTNAHETTHGQFDVIWKF